MLRRSAACGFMESSLGVLLLVASMLLLPVQATWLAQPDSWNAAGNSRRSPGSAVPASRPPPLRRPVARGHASEARDAGAPAQQAVSKDSSALVKFLSCRELALDLDSPC